MITNRRNPKQVTLAWLLLRTVRSGQQMRKTPEGCTPSQPRIRTSTQQIAERNLDELRKATEDPWRTKTSLRASSISDIWASHYALNDFALDPPILKIIQELYSAKPPGWKDRLVHFAVILEAGWAEYENKLKKELRYARLYSSSIERGRVTALTTFARFLRDEPWLPVVDDLRTSKRPCELVLNTEENRKLANGETPLSFCTFEEPSLISFLGIKEHPPETTPLLRLQYAVDRQEDDLYVFKNLYTDLAGDPGLDTNALRVAFRDHRLIFAPGHDSSYVTSKETVYATRTGLAPRMAAIKDAYPNLEEFFTESLGIPTAERLEHFVEFLRDYIWKYRPSISDNLRSAVESCYRKFFNHLNETQEEAREEALTLLKEQLGSSTLGRVVTDRIRLWLEAWARFAVAMPFCHNLGVADFGELVRPSHSSKMVLSTVHFGPPDLTKSRTFTLTLVLDL